MFSKINIRTTDDKNIVGNLFEKQKPQGWVLFLHAMQATKASYISLAENLQKAGYEGLAIDFRGHGNSDEGPEGYVNFSDEQQQEKINDVNASVAYLKTRGAATENISVVGASIGANLALQYASSESQLGKIVLLSPGLNYRGVTTKNFVTALRNNQSILFVGSEDDDYTAEAVNELFGLTPEGVTKQKIILKDGGHGTTMLERHPELLENIINFIKS